MLGSLCLSRLGVTCRVAAWQRAAQSLRKGHYGSAIAAPIGPTRLKPFGVPPAPTSSWAHSRSRAAPHPRRLFASSSVSEPQHGSAGEPASGAPKNRSIIIPVDNSKDSDYAVSWTLNNIYRAGDCLHLLHCIPRYHSETTFSDGEGGEPITIDAMSSVDLAIRQRHWATLEAVRKRFEDKLVESNVPKENLVYDILEEQQVPEIASASFFGVADIEPEVIPHLHAVDTFETPHMIGDVIIGKAEECNAAAVVMASHNKSPLAEFFLGSITNFCSHHCTKPVVVLHNLPQPDTDDSESGKTGRAVAVAVDNSSLSKASLQWTIDNVYRAGDTIHMIHVLPRISNEVAVADGFGVSFEELEGTQASVPKDSVSENYRNMLEAANVAYEIDLIQELHTDSIKGLGSAIVKKAEDLDASVLVMASHGKGVVREFFLGSLTSFVTHHANEVPVVVLHP